MYALKNDKGHVIGWDLETGEHGMFTHTAQRAIFQTEEEAWHYMDLLERLGYNVADVTVEKI